MYSLVISVGLAILANRFINKRLGYAGAAVVFTAIVFPLFTAWITRKLGCLKFDAEISVEDAV